MNIITNQHSYINMFFRSFPISIPLFFILLYTLTNNKYLLYNTVGICIIGLFIPFTKNKIMRPLNNILQYYTNTTDYPMIGRFTRPDGAKNANFFYNGEDNISYSLGMPSGHSMTAAFISMYFYLYLINSNNYTKKQKKTFSNFLLLFTIYTMYSRVYIFKVHTIQQTIIGAYLGYIFAIYYYKLSEKLIKN